MTGTRPVILCYHAVSETWRDPLSVTPQQLEAQVERYTGRGYVGLTFVEAERRRQAGTLPKKTLVVTFDDAFRSILAARPCLDRLGVPATVFVVGEFVAGDRLLEWPGIDHLLTGEHHDELTCLTEAELHGLQDAGWEIAAHTMTHPDLTSLDPASCLAELTASRALVAERFGSCETIAYPYGRANADVVAAAERAGYLAGCTLTISLRADEPLLRPRVAMSGTDTPVRALLKTSPGALWLRRTLPAALVERM